MKKIILIILFCSAGKLYAQRTTDYNNNNNNRATSSNNNNRPTNNVYDLQIHITDSTQEITADIEPVKNDPKIKNDRYYYWYFNKIIHSTQGGFTGQLLNGHYIAFYPDKNLKEEGNFKAGLKDGVWKTWNRKGDLASVNTWDEGIEVPNDQSIWKKIPFMNKKDAQPATTKPPGNQ